MAADGYFATDRPLGTIPKENGFLFTVLGSYNVSIWPDTKKQAIENHDFECNNKWHNVSCISIIQATLLNNPEMCNPDFRLKRTDWKVPVPSYTYNSYTYNPDFA